MALVMAVSDFLEQPLQPGRFPPDEAVVSFHDVTGDRVECGFTPVVHVLGTRRWCSGGQPLQDFL